MNKNQNLWKSAKTIAQTNPKNKIGKTAILKINQAEHREIFWNPNGDLWETPLGAASNESNCKKTIWVPKQMGVTSVILLLETQINHPPFFICDHINSTGKNPLIGKNIDEIGVRFPDQTEVYSKKWMAQFPEIKRKIGFSGVLPDDNKYVQIPSNFLFCAILANHAGMETIGIVATSEAENLIQKIIEKCP